MTKRYVGNLDDGELRIDVYLEEGERLSVYTLPLLAGQPGLPQHSPAGHNSGYSGSGPAQLAHDLLHDLLGYSPAGWLYQAFKRLTIATIPPGQFVLTEDQAYAVLGRILCHQDDIRPVRSTRELTE